MKLTVKNLDKHYDKELIIKKSSFSIEEGEIVALIGRNGTGKTTTLNIMANIIDSDNGEVSIDNKILKNNRELLNNIIFIPDNFSMFSMSSLKNIVSYYAMIYPDFDKIYFKEKMKHFKFKTSKTLRKFSKGQRAIITSVLAFASNAKFMLLDEPLDGIDIILRKKIVSLLIDEVEKGRSVVITSHQLLDLEAISDRILIFNEEKEIIDKSGSIDVTYKFQIAYEEEIFPMELANHEDLRIIESLGRIHTVVVKGNKDEWKQKFEKTNPLLIDELNINIKDTFIMESTRKGDEL